MSNALNNNDAAAAWELAVGIRRTDQRAESLITVSPETHWRHASRLPRGSGQRMRNLCAEILESKHKNLVRDGYNSGK